MSDYAGTLEYLYGLEKFGMVFGLENIEWILDIIGNPHRSLRAVHIGGTNGKGSTASMISRVLEEAGHKVGKYTSPHLLSFTERIVVNEEEIEEKEVAALTEHIRQRIEDADRNRFFTFFDFTTALAFEYFFRNKVDIAVIEVGLGGRLDSTNVLEPLVSVITNIDYDHTDYLGDSIEKIALEKAGIIKKRVPVISGVQGVAGDIIDRVGRESVCPVYGLGRDFSFEKVGDQHMSYRGLEKRLDDVFVGLRGDHQLNNGALALCTAECLSSVGFPLDEEAMMAGLSEIKWNGRLEMIREKPAILLDGAHNPHGARALAKYLRGHFTEKRKILVFGVMKDKDYESILKEILPLVDVVILTRPGIERALFPEQLERYAEGAIVKENLKGALEEAKRIARDEDLILVTGSLYTIGEVKSIINDMY
jgi:dihydrofolate synthase/folylpolyglutamate synthase